MYLVRGKGWAVAPASLPERTAARYYSTRMIRVQFTEVDVDRLCWHDCHIWGISFRGGSPERGDWTSELVLDIDFICEWCCTEEKGRFKVAPALLVFHGVQALAVAVNWEQGSLVCPLSIAEISRQLIGPCSLSPSKENSSWRIRLNWPEGGEIRFTAFGFTQTLRASPVLIEEQFLSWDVRNDLLLRGV
jgi:hypothetical protein